MRAAQEDIRPELRRRAAQQAFPEHSHHFILHETVRSARTLHLPRPKWRFPLCRGQ